jgi:drug/metabolite transporter (DMT)-like permease
MNVEGRHPLYEESQMMSRPDRSTLVAFAFLILIGGSNAVAVRFSNLELLPFWGAALRFAVAALIFWIIVAVRRIEIPRGRSLKGAVIFGILAIGANYALLYFALVEVQAGFTMVVTAFVPLLTLIFALAHGQEQFRWRGIIGALIAIGGIILALGGGLGTNVSLVSVLSLFLSVALFAEAPILLKDYPPSHPIATNAIAVTTGAILLLGVSLVVGENWALPATSDTWVSFIYLVFLGTVVLFYLYLLVLSRWTASATNYAFLLFPIVTVVIAAWLLGEEVTLTFVIGGAIVLVGIWVGAFSGSSAKSMEASVPEAALD